MRQVIILLAVIAFCSCGQKTATPPATTQNETRVDTMIEINSSKPKEPDEKIVEWKQYQDSLRNKILTSKDNLVLKESFLQEMYVRNVVTTSNDSLLVFIPFDLHAPDCGAPDCYSTDVSFGFTIGDTLIFPETLPFREHEHGCVEKESKLTGSFQLLEKSNKYIIYYSERPKRTLVLFSSNDETGTTAYYFTGLAKNRINGKNIYTLVKDYNEEDENSIYPLMSLTLFSEYENFLK